MVSGTACDIQKEISTGYLEASSWPDYETLMLTTKFFKGLIPSNIFVHNTRKLNNLLF